MNITDKWNKSSQDERFQVLLWLILSIFLIAAFWGKLNTPRLFLEIAGFALILSILWFKKSRLPISKSITFFILGSIGSLSLYLLPLPTEIWLQLPGRNLYQPVIQLLDQTGNSMRSHSISVDAYATAQTLLAILPPLAVFIGIACLERRQLYWLIWVFLAIAVVQVIWGILQYTTTGIAQGSYTNRNHYVALMELALPVAISLLVQHSIQPTANGKIPIQYLSLYGMASILIFIGGLLSTSRAGTAGLLLVLFMFMLILLRKLSMKQIMIGSSFFLLLPLLVMLNIDTTLLLNRFTALDPWEDPRWIMFSHALKGIDTFLPLGSGPGTFADTYTAFQPLLNVSWTFVSHAHNDYLELLFETGVLGAGIITAFLVIFISGCVQLWKQPTQELFYLKTGAAIGIMTALFHACFDFNFHVQPYPMFFALLVGVFITSDTSKSKR